MTAIGVENNEVDSGGGGKVTRNSAKLNNSLIWMLFLTLSNIDISLPEKNSPRDENVKAFVVQVTSLILNSMPIHPAQEAQIALLVIKKIQILSEYSNFSDVFLEKRASILLEATNPNQHAIKFQEDQPRQQLHLAFKVTR